MNLFKRGGILAFPSFFVITLGIYGLTKSNQDISLPVSDFSSSQDLHKISEKGLEEARGNKNLEELFKKLDDYTFRLFSPCSIGTGWILDYLIPEGDKYPTVWYIATNAHVVKEWFFDSTNPYIQKLPIKHQRIKHQDYYNWWASKYPLYSKESCYLRKNYKTFDINLSKQSDGKNLKTDWGAVRQNKIKQPRLFWAALDLFESDESSGIRKNHFKDFAVLEIEFTSEKFAREATKSFADKYKVDSTKAINIFGSPIDIEALKENSDNFYSLGYPSKSKDRFSYTKGWDEDTLEGEKLSTDPRNRFPISEGVKLKGHVSAEFFNNNAINWAGSSYYRVGHFYLLEGFPLGKGASGSMSVDKDGNLIGVKSKGELGVGAKYSMITPLRSHELYVEGNFRTPKYDLIVGAPKQKSSYKQQIEKFGKTTWLSARGWKHKS